MVFGGVFNVFTLHIYMILAAITAPCIDTVSSWPSRIHLISITWITFVKHLWNTCTSYHIYYCFGILQKWSESCVSYISVLICRWIDKNGKSESELHLFIYQITTTPMLHWDIWDTFSWRNIGGMTLKFSQHLISINSSRLRKCLVETSEIPKS